MPVVYTNDGSVVKTVKNLDWLLRHSSEVKEIRLDSFNWSDDDGNMDRAEMLVELMGGKFFMTSWADKNLCLQWIKRPSLLHAVHKLDGKVIWKGK